MVYYGARLHDIGKLSIDDAELNKAGPLTDAEYERMKFHTVSGAELLEAIPCFKPLIPAILGHHERLDGSGYPHGLKGDEIPLLARIVAVADAYDAMTSDRTYRKAMSSIDALSELDRCRDRHYDGACIDALKRAFETSDSNESIVRAKRVAFRDTVKTTHSMRPPGRVHQHYRGECRYD